MPVKNWRIWIRSPKARDGLVPDWLRCASKLELKTCVPNCSSSRTPVLTSRRERIHSAKPMTANKNKVNSDMVTNVISLWLVSTRS